MSKGVLAVVSGFSGAGKGTIMKALLKEYDDYALSISVTTRSPRPGEEDGREYFFRTREEVEKMIAEDQLLEYAEYVGKSLWNSPFLCRRYACQRQECDPGNRTPGCHANKTKEPGSGSGFYYTTFF